MALAHQPRPETPENIERVKAQLAFVSADCSYEKWRDVVWAVHSSGWLAAEEIAREWSMTAPERFDEKALDQVVRSFDHTRGITLGTLAHHAREGGWVPVSATPTMPTTPVPKHEIEGSQDRFTLLKVEDLRNLPRVRWRIAGVLPERGLAAIYGVPGCGKTFLALDLAGAIASGKSLWFVAKVRQGPVVYVGLEGEGGIRQRVSAWEMQNGEQLPGAFRVVLGGFTLMDAADAEALAAAIFPTVGPGAVVVIDTLNQAAPGADENSSTDMGRIIANAKALASAVEGIVILVHHAGKDASRGPRGHSSLLAAMDAVIEVSNGAAGRAWTLVKSKDGESGIARGFELAAQIVDQDEGGANITSCAIKPRLMLMQKPQKGLTGKNQCGAHEALTILAASHPTGIPMELGIKAVAGSLQCPEGRRTTRAKETINSLVESGHLRQDEGGIFLT